MIDEHNPDIICGWESHIDSSYFNAEIFPTTFTVLRKDRVKGAGGVFLCIRENLHVHVWRACPCWNYLAKLSLSKRSPLYVCSFYHPPSLSNDPIAQLGSSLNIIRRFTSLPNNIVMGDFNLPSINWLDRYGQIIPNPNYGVGLNNLLLDLINDIGFNQFVDTPTRNNNILDLVLSTSTCHK